MIEALSPCFSGSFAYWRDVYRLRRPGEAGEAGLPGPALLDAAVTTGLLERFAATYPGADRRAVVSMWTQWYFGSLMVPASAALLLLDRELPVALDELRLVFGADGRLEAVLIERCDGEPGCRQNRFVALVDHHVAPLIGHLAQTFGVSPRLLWTNAAAVLDWTLGEARAAGRAAGEKVGARPCEAASTELSDQLSCRVDRCGRRNPLCGAMHYPVEAEGPVRRRRTCCLRYLLPGVPCCGSLCPLPELRTAALQN